MNKPINIALIALFIFPEYSCKAFLANSSEHSVNSITFEIESSIFSLTLLFEADFTYLERLILLIVSILLTFCWWEEDCSFPILTDSWTDEWALPFLL